MKKGQISMEYLLIVGVILVIAAGAVLTMTKFNPSKQATEGLSKSTAQLSEMNAAVGPLGIKQAGLYANSTLILRLINNKADTIAITGIKVCDATSADCNLPADAACASGACHVTSSPCTVSSLASGSESTIYCAPGTALWTGANPGDAKKVTVALAYTLGGVPGTTTATTMTLNAL